MGGDLGPAEVVEAVKLALAQQPALNPITLVGDEAQLAPLIARAGLRVGEGERLALLHAPEVITMDDKPVLALRRKKNSSMLRAIELVKNGSASVVVSCGNTGALMAGGTLRLRTMQGVARPALGAVVPRAGGYFVLIDAGANPDARPEHLLHNAILGSHYWRVRLGRGAHHDHNSEREGPASEVRRTARAAEPSLPLTSSSSPELPRVGLMSIGTEEGKGNALTGEAHALLRAAHDMGILNYAGPIEGFQVFAEAGGGGVDVVVCDGFVGNIMLKSWESLVKFFSSIIKTELRANPLRMAGAMMAKGAFTALKSRIDPDSHSGAPLLGLRGNILKAHGSSKRTAICAAICAAGEIITAEMNQHIEADVLRAAPLLSPSAQTRAATASTATPSQHD